MRERAWLSGFEWREVFEKVSEPLSWGVSKSMIWGGQALPAPYRILPCRGEGCPSETVPVRAKPKRRIKDCTCAGCFDLFLEAQDV